MRVRSEQNASAREAAAAPGRGPIGSVVVLGVIAIGLLFTWLAAHQTRLANERSGERALAARANLIEFALRDRLLTYEAVLHAGVGLFEASQGVTANEFRTFVDQLQLAHSYPGLQGLGFARRIRVANAASLPEAGSRDHTTIEYLEPLDERNLRAIGYDMMTETIRRQAMERARDSGRVVLSGGVILVQEITTPKQPGFLMYAPLYETGRTPLTLEERRKTLVGFVYCPFRAGDFLTSVVRDFTTDLQLEIFDAERNSKVALLYRNRMPDAPAPETAIERNLEVLEHQWSIRIAPRPEFYAALNTTPLLRVWGAGTAATAFVAMLVWALARSREHLSARLASERLSGQRERYSYSVLQNSLDAYIAIDAEDRIIEWNPQAIAMFGWTEQEARGLRLADTIVPERYRAAHLAALQSFGKRAPRLIGTRVEMPARRRDGTELTMELSLLATSRDNQPVFVASMRDVTELRRQQRQIELLNATLEHRVQDRTRELAVANRELHAANAQLEAFAQNVSHDLRAPLRAIEGYTRLVADEHGRGLDEEAHGYLSSVMRNARKMQRLIDDMLRLAFVGRQPIGKRMINLWTVVLGVLGDLQKPAGIVIHARPDELGDVFADPSLLEHALRNLLSNAIKFSQRATEPTITIGSEMRAGERVFYVRDNGVGFEKQHAEKLFEAFHRLHRDQEYEGTGVGLTIVKNIIERHGGRVWADADVGKGATFYFTLDDRPESPESAADANAQATH